MALKHLFAVKALVISSLPLSPVVHALGWHHGISLGLTTEQSELALSSDTQTLAELDNLSSNFLDNFAIQGYSISSNWAFSYQLNQYKTELTDVASDYKQQNIQFDVGMSVYKFDSGLNIYPLIGVRHKSADLVDVKLSNTQAYAGVRLDIPVMKNLFAHVKADHNLGSDKNTNLGVAINYRYARHHSIMLELNQSKVEINDKYQNTSYQLQRDASQLALRWFVVW